MRGQVERGGKLNGTFDLRFRQAVHAFCVCWRLGCTRAGSAVRTMGDGSVLLAGGGLGRMKARLRGDEGEAVGGGEEGEAEPVEAVELGREQGGMVVGLLYIGRGCLSAW